MGEYITEEEVAARWANYQDFATRQGHYWVGNGPYYLDSVFPVENTITLKHFANFPDLADKWAGFSEPKLADVTVDGSARVTAGAEAAFDIFVDYADAPYPLAEIAGVKILVFDATGALVWNGEAEAVEEGYYTITLTAEVTSLLTTGAARIDAIVVSNVVAIPVTTSFEFVVE
jgi:peptide/nickel transport system substrate-binding protein